MKAIKGKQLQDIGHQPLGQNSRQENDTCTYKTHKKSRTHTYKQSPTHFLPVSCTMVFSSFSSVWRGSTGLMTFPMRHKHCTWEADSRAARVCMWETFMHICMSLWRAWHMQVLLCICSEVSCEFTSWRFWKTSHLYFCMSEKKLCLCRKCSHATVSIYGQFLKNNFVSEEFYAYFKTYCSSCVHLYEHVHILVRICL